MLTSRDGSIELSGTLLGFDGDFYRLDTIYGELTVDGSGVLCDGPGCPNLQDYVAELRISGAASMGEVLMPALVQAFASRNNYLVGRETRDDTHFQMRLLDKASNRIVARFEFRITNTDEGFADLLANETDIVMSLREIRQQEARRAREAGMGDMTSRGRSRVLALDALVPIVAPDNPLSRITPTELADLFAGSLKNWKPLTGLDAPVDLHLRVATSGLGQAVEDLLLKPGRKNLANGIERHGTDRALAEVIEENAFAISVASASETGNAKRLALSGACGYSLSASRLAVKTEDYPLTAPMFLYLPARRLPKLAREFLRYTRSPSAQQVIRRAGFVDQSPEEISIDVQGNRFANAIARAGTEVSLAELQRLVETLSEHKRLTTTFRFETGSTRLDAQSRSNVQQLASALEAGYYDERHLLFVGFSDGDGPAEANKEISARRAKVVRDAVLNAAETANPDRLTLETEAFGEAMPMACDDSAWGRQVNRRVEVWVK